jgi:tetratricopeptide (TPR) repeat protein
VLDRYGKNPEPALRQLAARALISLGVTLGKLGRREEAVAAFLEVRERYGEDPEPALRQQTARALIYLGVALRELDQLEEAVTAFLEVRERYGEDPTSALREQAAKALVNQATRQHRQAGDPLWVRLGVLVRSEEEVTAYQAVLERYGEDPPPASRELAARALYNLGVTLEELGRSEEAVAAFQAVLERYGEDPAPALREVVEIVNPALVSEPADQ